MVIDLFKKVGLDGERVVEIFAVEILFGLFYKDASDASVIELGTACSADHLQNVGHGEIHIAFLLGVVELGPFDDHETGWEVDPPG